MANPINTSLTNEKVIAGWNYKRNKGSMSLSQFFPFIDLIALYKQQDPFESITMENIDKLVTKSQYETTKLNRFKKKLRWYRIINDSSNLLVTYNPSKMDAEGNVVEYQAVRPTDIEDGGYIQGIPIATSLNRHVDFENLGINNDGVGIISMSTERGAGDSFNMIFNLKIHFKDTIIMEQYLEYISLITLNSYFLINYGWLPPGPEDNFQTNLSPPSVYGGFGDQAPVYDVSQQRKNSYFSSFICKLWKYEYSFDGRGGMEASLDFMSPYMSELTMTRTIDIQQSMLYYMMNPEKVPNVEGTVDKFGQPNGKGLPFVRKKKSKTQKVEDPNTGEKVTVTTQTVDSFDTVYYSLRWFFAALNQSLTENKFQNIKVDFEAIPLSSVEPIDQIISEFYETQDAEIINALANDKENNYSDTIDAQIDDQKLTIDSYKRSAKHYLMDDAEINIAMESMPDKYPENYFKYYGVRLFSEYFTGKYFGRTATDQQKKKDTANVINLARKLRDFVFEYNKEGLPKDLKKNKKSSAEVGKKPSDQIQNNLTEAEVRNIGDNNIDVETRIGILEKAINLRRELVEKTSGVARGTPTTDINKPDTTPNTYWGAVKMTSNLKQSRKAADIGKGINNANVSVKDTSGLLVATDTLKEAFSEESKTTLMELIKNVTSNLAQPGIYINVDSVDGTGLNIRLASYDEFGMNVDVRALNARESEIPNDDKIFTINYGHANSLCENVSLETQMDPSAGDMYHLPVSAGGSVFNLLENMREFGVLGANDDQIKDDIAKIVTAQEQRPEAVSDEAKTVLESLSNKNINIKALYEKLMNEANVSKKTDKRAASRARLTKFNSALTKYLQKDIKKYLTIGAFAASKNSKSLFSTLLGYYLKKTSIEIHGTCGLNAFEYINIKNLFRGVSGLYSIIKINDEIDSSGFVTKIEAMLVKPNLNESTVGAVDSNNYDSSSSRSNVFSDAGNERPRIVDGVFIKPGNPQQEN